MEHPAVVWDDDGGPCETVFDGKTGYRAKPYDVEDFAEKILKIVDVRKERFSAVVRSFVEEKFSCDRHLEILEETFRKLDSVEAAC